MWEKHGKEIVGCILIAVITVLALLVMVCVFEQLNLHVPGSREMWIGLIGAVLGGAFTLLGVLLTIYKQEEADNEKTRLENMPILGFEMCYSGEEADTVLTVREGKIITCGFGVYMGKEFVTIKINSVNNLCAFDFTVEECAINGKSVIRGDAFNPSKERIAIGESTTFVFDNDEIKNKNCFCIIRFSYNDIFGNKYYQDFPFIYFETASFEVDARVKQIIEIRDIKQPILVNSTTKSLEEAAKEYVDYETFCKL